MSDPRRLIIACLLCSVGCARSGSSDGVLAPASLTVECSQPSAARSSTWVCPDSLELSCGTSNEPIAVQSPSGTACNATQLSLSPLATGQLGDQTVTVLDDRGNALCTTAVTITDAAPRLVPHTLQLWPPNHKFHDISVSDCVSVADSCDPDLHPEFIWASSDEPVDDVGDGHFAPDIMISDDCQHVSLRSERQGPSDGRVYKLGVRVIDRNGNAIESTCAVVVDHDQSGAVGADSGEAYRVTFDDPSLGPICGGEPPTPPSPPPASEPAPE